MSHVIERIVCADGVSLSVQASDCHYCTPRDDAGPYTHVEVGYPSVVPPRSWMQYAEDRQHPRGTVYGYVPIEMVVRFIKRHGGISKGAMP
jgi:hypothetical protein